MKIKKKKNGNLITEALSEAQELIFAPLAFQSLNAMSETGILDLLYNTPSSESDIITKLGLNEYIVRTLLDIGILNKLVKKSGDLFSLTKKGEMFVCDDMTKINFNFVKDVCYLGASELTESFKSASPKGLHKFIGNFPTIYPALVSLPENIKKSWYDFDNFYSDNCFNTVCEIISKKYSSIFDIGGNTGNFERLCISKNIDVTMLDLKENINEIKNNPELKKCKFFPINVLDNNPQYPKIKNSAIFMSQFLDCFSKKDITKILTDLKNTADDNSAIYILEPYTDMQNFEAAKYSLTHISLYFTSMANGVSKFYTLKETEELINEAGLQITACYNNIGSFDYTLIECKKHAMA